MQQQGMQIGISRPENIYETAMELEKEMGYKDGERFWTDPRKSPPPPPQKPEMVQAEEVKGQIAMQLEPMKLQAQASIEDKKTQNNLHQAQFEASTQAQLKQFEIEKQAELKRFEIEQDAMLQKYKIDKQIEADILKAQIAAHASIRSAHKQETGEDPEDPEVQQRKAQDEEKGNRRDQVAEQTLQALAQAIQHMARPKKIIRGPDGRATGVQ
jgi:hypothetical protein